MRLRCADVSVTVGSAVLLDGFDLDGEAGSWTAVIGPNGAGKSTALRALAGLVAHGGTVELDGSPADELSTRERARRTAFVPQTPTVPPATTVADYVRLGRTPFLGPLAVEGREDRRRVAEALTRLDLDGFADRRVDTLSGGERQRAVVARALVQEAPIVLLDEPTTGLDLGHQVEVLDLVDELRRSEGLTVVCTMHDLGLAGQYADTMVLLDAGRTVGTGAPAEVLTAERIGRLYRTAVEVVSTAHGPVVVPVRSASVTTRGWSPPTSAPGSAPG